MFRPAGPISIHCHVLWNLFFRCLDGEGIQFWIYPRRNTRDKWIIERKRAAEFVSSMKGVDPACVAETYFFSFCFCGLECVGHFIDTSSIYVFWGMSAFEPECCHSKRARYQLSHPSPYGLIVTDLNSLRWSHRNGVYSYQWLFTTQFQLTQAGLLPPLQHTEKKTSREQFCPFKLTGEGVSRSNASKCFLNFCGGVGWEWDRGWRERGFSGKNRGENLFKIQAGLCCERYRTISFSFAPLNP